MLWLSGVGLEVERIGPSRTDGGFARHEVREAALRQNFLRPRQDLFRSSLRISRIAEHDQAMIALVVREESDDFRRAIARHGFLALEPIHRRLNSGVAGRLACYGLFQSASGPASASEK
jgi:hypothetical protein